MKALILSSVLLLAVAEARDPGTGSNTTVGPGVATPDSGARDTSVMGGGTPGNMGINTKDIDEPQEEQERTNKQKQMDKENITDQNSNLDSL